MLPNNQMEYNVLLCLRLLAEDLARAEQRDDFSYSEVGERARELANSLLELDC